MLFLSYGINVLSGKFCFLNSLMDQFWSITDLHQPFNLESQFLPNSDCLASAESDNSIIVGSYSTAESLMMDQLTPTTPEVLEVFFIDVGECSDFNITTCEISKYSCSAASVTIQCKCSS